MWEMGGVYDEGHLKTSSQLASCLSAPAISTPSKYGSKSRKLVYSQEKREAEKHGRLGTVCGMGPEWSKAGE